MLSVENIFDLVYENLFSLILLLVFFSLSKNVLSLYLSRKRLPLGPTGLPIVGYLPFLGKAPHRTFAKLSQKYGNVFTLQLGTNNVVILNDFESIKDAFSKDALLGRPHHGQFEVGDRAKSFIDDSGQVWKEQRRFSMQLLRDLGYGKGSMEDKIVEEIGYMLERIEKSGTESIDYRKMLTPSMSNNVSQLVFGHRLESDDPQRVLLDKQIDEGIEIFSPTSLFSTLPKWFTNILIKAAFNKKKIIEQFLNIFDQEISNHQKSFDENNKRDYIDGYLSEMAANKRKGIETSFTLEKLHSNSSAYFGAGSETVRTTTEWCLLSAAHYSDYQKKVQDEIDAIVGNDRVVSWADRLQMPFTQAFICESQRWKTTIAVNLYRRTVEDTYILEHFIPKDTLVLANFWAVHNDPKLWKDPEQFNPNRFLSDDGKSLVNTEHLIPFSIGKRSCVGETLAKIEVFLYFTSILQKYTISATDGQTISFEENFGLSLQPKVNSLLKFKKRF